MPGFRSRNLLKAALAIVGYAIIGLFVILGVVTTYPTVTVLAIGAFIVVLLAFDGFGLRRRIPGIGGNIRTLAAVTWLGLLALIIAAAVGADSLLLTAEERMGRAARASQAAARTAAPEPSATATVLVATSRITPTPATTAALSTNPSATPSAPASTNPPVTAIPTFSSAPIATPSAPPGTPQAVAYTVIQRKDLSLANRTRTEVRIVVTGQPTKEQKIATLAAAARTELRPHVVLINAFRTVQEERECSATVGQAELSTDGRGWNVNTGETLRWGVDNREIQGSVVTEVDERTCLAAKEERFSTAP
jgi:hypothetical protein